MSADFQNVNAGGVDVAGTYTPDRLFDRDTVTRVKTIASGAGILARGTLLGKITASGKYVKSLTASADGSEVPDAILLEAVDATAADVNAAVAIAGQFGVGGVVFGAAHTAASVEAVLRTKDIYLDNLIG
jgi:hypothetical protein